MMTSRFIGDADTYPMKSGVLYRELHGVAHIAHYLDALFEAVPDGLVKLLDTKVRKTLLVLIFASDLYGSIYNQSYLLFFRCTCSRTGARTLSASSPSRGRSASTSSL